MFGHGKHHNCALCNTAKSLGLMKNCADAQYADSSHKRGEELDDDEDLDIQEKAENV